MLIARNIYKNYGTLPVLKGVDIEISKGDIVSIAGSSGAGKSTLLHILGTLDSADKGEIFLELINSIPFFINLEPLCLIVAIDISAEVSQGS